MLSCRSPPAYLPCNLKRQAFVYLFMHFLLTLELALELPLPIKVSNLKITMGYGNGLDWESLFGVSLALFLCASCEIFIVYTHRGLRTQDSGLGTPRQTLSLPRLLLLFNGAQNAFHSPAYLLSCRFSDPSTA